MRRLPAGLDVPAAAAAPARKGDHKTMTDFRTMFDKEYLGAWDLADGKDAVVVIERVEGKTIKGKGGEENRKPVLYFVGKKKAFVCNVTNARTIARLYGKHVEAWTGKAIALYATMTSVGGEEVDCIRVRPDAPAMPAKRGPVAVEAEKEAAS